MDRINKRKYGQNTLRATVVENGVGKICLQWINQKERDRKNEQVHPPYTLLPSILIESTVAGDLKNGTKGARDHTPSYAVRRVFHPLAPPLVDTHGLHPRRSRN